MHKDKLYIKCTYHDGLFPSEYIATIPTINGYEPHFVNRNDVLPLDKLNNGLLKVCLLDKDSSKALITINDVSECSLSTVLVSLENLVCHK